MTTTRKPYVTAPPAPAGPCTADNCKLPDCFCFGAVPDMAPADLPQFVMLTFDDGVTAQLYNKFYRALIVDNDYNITNPSGCRIKTALFITIANTDFSKLKAVWDAGNEVASHTINHATLVGEKESDYPPMVEAIEGLRRLVLNATGNQNLTDAILGFRAPYLRVGGNMQFDVLRDYKFLYDSSISNIEIAAKRKPVWPFTCDYLITNCVNPPCPTNAYPGFWEVPMNSLIGDNGYSCSMIDACSVGADVFQTTRQEWYNFFKQNFESHFYPVKVPMPIFTHGSMFLRSIESYPALVAWIKDVLQTRTDVWFVTPKQVLHWMKQPLTNAQMIQQKWGC